MPPIAWTAAKQPPGEESVSWFKLGAQVELLWREKEVGWLLDVFKVHLIRKSGRFKQAMAWKAVS